MDNRDEKHESAVNYLSAFIPVDLNDARERILLIRAIEYAGLENYQPDDKDLYSTTYTEIFYVRAICHFNFKKLAPIKENYEKMNQIKNYEINQIALLKRKLPLNINYFK